jgi:radical SAM protein with 4Fe4S-binding SPASM domain
MNASEVYYSKLGESIELWKQPFGGTIIDWRRKVVNTMNKTGFELLELSSGDVSVEQISETMAKRHDDKKEIVLPKIDAFLKDASKRGYVKIHDSKQEKASIIVNGSSDHYSPYHANLELTMKCNLRCKHCYVDAGKEVPNEMTKEEVFSVLEKLHKSGVVVLCLTGGEPMIRKDFFEILEYCKDRFISIQILTNGCFVDETSAKRLGEYKNIVCQISLDGDNPGTHEAVRGVKGAFEKACNAIKLLSQNGVRAIVAMTVVPFSMDQVEQTYKLAKSLGAATFRAGRILPTGRAKNLAWVLDDKQMADVEAVITKLNKAHGEDVEPWQSTITDERLQKSKDTHNCGAGYMQITIAPNGDLRPCPPMDSNRYNQGNILKTDIPEVWKKLKVSSCSKITSPGASELCRGCEKQYMCRICISAAAVVAEGHECKWEKKELEPIFCK